MKDCCEVRSDIPERQRRVLHVVLWINVAMFLAESIAGVLAHSTHVRGLGTYENSVEKCRAKVTLASQIPEEKCREISLGYRDPKSIRAEEFANREEEGVLLVPKAGEMLFQLNHPPAWAAGC